MASEDSSPRHLLTTTGDPTLFSTQMDRFFPTHAACCQVAQARWESGDLRLP
jgi:hypothetical protein